MTNEGESRVQYIHMHFIIGLGNPGATYENTRHNVGRLLVARLQEQVGDANSWKKDNGAQALLSQGKFGSFPVEFVLPETFMNRSGETVAYLSEKCGAAPEELIVVYDDVDLPLGSLRIAHGRGAGGHNGIGSIIAALKHKDFIRVRIGIAPTSFWTGKVKRPQGGGKLERFVLGAFSRSERSTIDEIASRVFDAIETIVTEGSAKAMNEFN